MEQASEVGTLRQPLLDRVKEQYNEIFLVGRHLAELFCTSTDAMWAVCLGHRGKDGNSAYWQGEQTGKQETNTKNNPQNTKKKQKQTQQPGRHLVEGACIACQDPQQLF